MVVDLISGEWKRFVPDGLAKLSALQRLRAVASSPEHTVVTLEECDSWAVILVLLDFFVNDLQAQLEKFIFK